MSDDHTPLRRFRESQTPKITLKMLADELGIDIGHLSRIEREGAKNADIALRLSRRTGVPVEQIIEPRREDRAA